jgi:S-DNA-T family DNA segregation ATPase FtsK/SpoIIIE
MFILVTTLALYLLLALSSYSPDDPGWSHTGRSVSVVNQGGVVGAWLADVLFYLCGYMAYLFPVMVAYAGWMLTRNGDGKAGTKGEKLDGFHLSARGIGFVVTLAAGCGLATLHYQAGSSLPLDAGGVLGAVIGNNLQAMLSTLGATLLLLALFLSGFSLFTGVSWLTIMDETGYWTLWLVSRGTMVVRRISEYRRARHARQRREAQVNAARTHKKERVPPRIEPVVAPPLPSVRAQMERQVPLFDLPTDASGLPPLGLLDEPPSSRHTISHAALEAMSRQVELKLRDFGIEVEVVAVHPGPVITRFELQPAPGVKASRITNLARDLARSLSTTSVRIVEVIPGKSVIGLEIPNEVRELVCLSEIVKSSSYDHDPSPLSLALGKDIGGQPVVVDLARMPHLLVAGTTGSGKSVAINAMVLSLLYKAKASDVRLIMIDPKMLELSVYEGIPHLLAPVVTDMKQASSALRWCAGFQRASLVRRRNGTALPAHVDAGRAQYRRLQPQAQRGGRLWREAERSVFHAYRGEPGSAGTRRRTRRHDDDHRQKSGATDCAPGAKGAGFRGASHPRHPTAFRRRHHRSHQGEYSQPHRLSSLGESGLAHCHRSDGRGNPARPRRHAVSGPGDIHSVPCPRRLRVRSGSASSGKPSAQAGQTDLPGGDPGRAG